MPIDLSTVKWDYVATLAGLVFVATLLGSIIAFRNKFAAAIIATVLFTAAFVFLTYYPRDNLPEPIRSLPSSPK